MGLSSVVLEKSIDDEYVSSIKFSPNYTHIIDVSNNLSGNKYVKLQDDTSHDRHLLCIKEGSGSILLEDVIRGFHKEYDLEKGDKLLIPSWVAYTITLYNGSKALKFGEKEESGIHNIYETRVDFSDLSHRPN